MKTLDIQPHLLNTRVGFDRLFDKISVRIFGKRLE